MIFQTLGSISSEGASYECARIMRVYRAENGKEVLTFFGNELVFFVEWGDNDV